MGVYGIMIMVSYTAISMEHLRNIYRISMEYLLSIYGISVEYLRNIYGISMEWWLMWVKQCHKPPMTGNGLYIPPMNMLILGDGLWHCFTPTICFVKWVCLKIGYIPNYSHLIGIMISKTIGFKGLAYFQTHPNSYRKVWVGHQRNLGRSSELPGVFPTSHGSWCCAVAEPHLKLFAMSTSHRWLR